MGRTPVLGGRLNAWPPLPAFPQPRPAL